MCRLIISSSQSSRLLWTATSEPPCNVNVLYSLSIMKVGAVFHYSAEMAGVASTHCILEVHPT